MNLKTIAVLVVAQVGLTACANMSDGQRAALIGAGIGTVAGAATTSCLLYTSPSPRDGLLSRMPSSA